ncbi:hypothetical protein [Amycolatopsis sp. cmx-4-68]|uniref:hypothetical protein n=1 Tax=Amycolatopsis sp. cmx-4-68 TaxID=2790938 RepID=UPI00397897B9
MTLSIGGNDARFSKVLQHCMLVAVPWCEESRFDSDADSLSVAEPALIQGPVFDNIVLALNAIHNAAPNARILLMGYPRLLTNNGFCLPGIASPEGSWLNEMGDKLDETIERAANFVRRPDYPVIFGDPRPDFGDHGACALSGGLIHDIVVGTTRGEGALSQQSLHPTALGALVYSATATKALAR